MGKPFTVGPQKSIEAEGDLLGEIKRKGFHRMENLDGPFYVHPMIGVLCLYPGSFLLKFSDTTLPLKEYLSSLQDSNYTEVRDAGSPVPHALRCDACKAEGNVFPNPEIPFPHRSMCPNAAQSSAQ
jgi:hypothetical protein